MSMLRESVSNDGDAPATILDEDHYQDCRFVLIDESHNLRHANTQRYNVLSDFMVEGGDRKVLMLTATPFNKSPWDIYNQVKTLSPRGDHTGTSGSPESTRILPPSRQRGTPLTGPPSTFPSEADSVAIAAVVRL